MLTFSYWTCQTPKGREWKRAVLGWILTRSTTALSLVEWERVGGTLWMMAPLKVKITKHSTIATTITITVANMTITTNKTIGRATPGSDCLWRSYYQCWRKPKNRCHLLWYTVPLVHGVVIDAKYTQRNIFQTLSKVWTGSQTTLGSNVLQCWEPRSGGNQIWVRHKSHLWKFRSGFNLRWGWNQNHARAFQSNFLISILSFVQSWCRKIWELWGNYFYESWNFRCWPINYKHNQTKPNL